MGFLFVVFGNLISLLYLDVSKNFLSGMILMVMVNLVFIVGMNLVENEFNGSIVGLFLESIVWC